MFPYDGWKVGGMLFPSFSASTSLSLLGIPPHYKHTAICISLRQYFISVIKSKRKIMVSSLLSYMLREIARIQQREFKLQSNNLLTGQEHKLTVMILVETQAKQH